MPLRYVGQFDVTRAEAHEKPLEEVCSESEAESWEQREEKGERVDVFGNNDSEKVKRARTSTCIFKYLHVANRPCVHYPRMQLLTATAAPVRFDRL